ncbi:SLBB domain-containing protein [Aquirufa sp. 5-AUSEE-100C1]
MTKRIYFVTLLIWLLGTQSVLSQFQVPSSYIPTGPMNQAGPSNKPIGSSKVLKREVINTKGQKSEMDSLVAARQAQDFNTNNTEEDSIKKVKIALQNKIFGFSIFNKKAGVFEPNLKIATPKNYVLGPDDELIVDINGYSEEHYNLTVNADGYVKVNKIGNVYVAGLTIEEAQNRLIYKLSSIYIGLKKFKGRTDINGLYASISLGNIRTIQVSVVGEVQFPGTYSVPSLSKVMNVLYLAGGPTENGSFRDVQLVRNNKIIAHLDLYEFITQGFSKSDITVRDQDIIKIGLYKSRIEIKGRVKRSAFFEPLPSESLATIFENYAGGFLENAYKDLLKVERITKTERKLIDINYSIANSFFPADGDIILAEAITENRYENRVTLEGEVFRPGIFSLDQKLTLSSLIKKAGGVKENAFLTRVTINRMNKDFTPSNISVNLADIFNGKATDIPLEREDRIRVFSITELREAYTVTIHGEINGIREDLNKKKAKDDKNNNNLVSQDIEKPKNTESSEISDKLKSNNESNVLLNRQVKITIPFESNMTVEDLIVKAGGLRESASTGFVEVVRRKKNEIGDNQDFSSSQIAEVYKFSISKNLIVDESASKFELSPFDEVFVRSSPNYELQQFITLQGQVLYPGVYGLEKKDDRLSDLIKRAGGLNKQAYPEGAKLIRKTELSESESEIKKNQLKDINDNFNGIVVNNASENSGTNHETIGINLVAALAQPGGPDDIQIINGDVINIPREPQTVKITGEILYPNNVKYTESKSLGSYISSAGGFTSSSARKRVYVIYSNGSVKRTRNFLFMKFYPRVERGSEIIVPKKIKSGNTSQQIVSVVSVLTGTVTSIIGIITLIKATAQ